MTEYRAAKHKCGHTHPQGCGAMADRLAFSLEMEPSEKGGWMPQIKLKKKEKAPEMSGAEAKRMLLLCMLHPSVGIM